VTRASATICRIEVPSNPYRANCRVATRSMRSLVVIYLPLGKLKPLKKTLAEGIFTITKLAAVVKSDYFSFFLTTRFSLISTWTPHSGHM